MNEIESYIYGFLLTDGHIYLNKNNPNKGKVYIEVSEKDQDIIIKLNKLVPNSSLRSRIRSTNFATNYHSYIFENSRKEFRDKLMNWGIPSGKKSAIADIPKVDYYEDDFWRGVIDGDGSIGISSKNRPFISLVTKSENLKENFLDYLKRKLNIVKNLKRNKRDNVYNIMITMENSIKLSSILYYKNCPIYLDRKYNKFIELSNWRR